MTADNLRNMSEQECKNHSKAEEADPSPDAQPLLNLSPLSLESTEEGNNQVSVTHKCLNFSPLWKQMFGSSGPAIAVLSSGMTAGYSAILIPQLKAPESSIPVTEEKITWIASIAVFAMAIGCVFISLLMDKFGRRRSLQIFSIPSAIGWIIITFSSDEYMMYVGRFLTGLYVGLTTPVSTVFVAETSAPKYRGFLIAASNLGIPVGIFITHLLGMVCSWRVVAAVGAVFPLICLLLISLVPESPPYLLSQSQVPEARKSFEWYRGNKNEAVREFSQLLVKYESQNTENNKTSVKSIRGLKVKWEDLLKISFLRPLSILLFFFFVQQFCGINALIFYTVTILKKIGVSMNEYTATIVIDGMRILVSVLACWLLRHYGRRPLAIFSAFGTAVSLILLSVYFFISVSLGEGTKMSWIPILLLILYIWTSGVGLVPLPWVMSGEVFPASTRAIGSGLSSCFGFVVYFTVVKTGPMLFDSLGNAFTFLIYGAVAFVGFLFLFRYLPETKNKTLQQIEENRQDNVV